MTSSKVLRLLPGLIAWTFATSGGQAPGAATVVPVQLTGDPQARFTLVVLGDGYTAGELPLFRQHLDKHLNVLWSIEPFRSYRSYINVYAVEIVSADSGITCDPEFRQPRRTPLGASFAGGCTDPNARGIGVSQEAARRYAALATPHFDQILVIANTGTYGGIGGAVATTSGGNSLGPLITPHELGHSLGRLQDEYTYSARGRPGGPYEGPEPDSIHMTLLTEEQMRAQQAKWFRWLGEESEAGGRIARYEGGLSRTTGIWRPSRHSMMISVGYYFDQVSRERMTARIAEQVRLIADSTPTEGARSRSEVLWIETPQPVFHELEIRWEVDGVELATARNLPYFDPAAHAMPASAREVAVTVVDPTPFVRDPAIRESALTARRVWSLAAGPAPPPPAGGPAPAFTSSTPVDRPVSGSSVVHVTTVHPRDRVLPVVWRLAGRIVQTPAAARAFPLAVQKLPAGTHTLTATIVDPRVPSAAAPIRKWTVDNTPPEVRYALADPVMSVRGADGSEHALVRSDFTMKLEPRDDHPGYVVAEFRVNGDGWHHYYGWPDAGPQTPFRFTPRGTTIKELVYGSLSREGLSPQPWEPREPGWGTHRIEYRGIDAAGNVSAARAFRVTLLPALTCSRVIAGQHPGDVRVDIGVTCLEAATVTGSVSVAAGASLIADNSTIEGALTAQGPATIELAGTRVGGPVRITGALERVTLFGAMVDGDAVLSDNRTAAPMLIAGSGIGGRLTCIGNSTAPVNGGTPSRIMRGATAQCAEL